MLDEWGLLGKEVVAIDGTKIKASNNKKRNMNRDSLSRRLMAIDARVAEYMEELDRNDLADEDKPEIDVAAVLKGLMSRKQKYEGYLQELEASGENEISLTDPDARLMGNNRGGVDVCYNVQSAVDAKHHIIVEMNVINNPADHGQLSVMAKRVKKRLKIKRSFTVLADTGYYNGPDLKRCKKNKITAIVARQKTGKDAPDTSYNADKFVYTPGTDYFTCPAGSRLNRTGAKDRRTYENRNACRECDVKDKCTRTKYRKITVSHYEKIFNDADRRLAENKELYRQRQMLVEHPNGTVKHTMNGGYFLLRGLRKVRGEVALLFLGYNLKRAFKILGFKEMMAKIQAYSLHFLSCFCETGIREAQLT